MPAPNIKKDFTAPASTGLHDIKVFEKPDHAETTLSIANLNLEIPAGQDILIHQGNLHLKQGDHIALTGANGSGKSSLFRAFMGLWNSGTGTIEIKGQSQNDIFCASQQSRMPDTGLDGMLSYPHPENMFSAKQYEDALKEAEYEEIIPQLPWNAAKPDNIANLCEKIIDKTLTESIKNIMPGQAPAFINGLHTALNKHLAVPRIVQKFFSKRDHLQLAAYLANRAEEKVKQQNSVPSSSLWMPRRAGKKAGEKLAGAILRELDSNLVRGGRLKLSGGQVQKLAFARIFLQKPPIMFLDEPTSAMHPETAHSLLEKVMKNFKNSIIIAIVHDSSLLKFFTKHADLRNKQLTVKPVDNTKKHVTVCEECPYKPH